MIAVPKITEFPPLKQIGAGALNVGYAEVGPTGGKPVVLLHGWPYDIHSYVDVAPLLAATGYRVIVPYVRGHGTTRFLSGDTTRNGQQGAIALDAIAFMDALKIPKAIIGGFDWGARTGNIIAALWPERCKGMVSVSGYLIGSQAAGRNPLLPRAEYQWWYQYYFATERGRLGYQENTHEFNKLIWQLASPRWNSRQSTIAAPQPSTIPTMSTSSSTTTAGGSDWLKASRNIANSRASSPKRRTSLCRQSRSKATRMAHHTQRPPPTPRNSRASTSTG
jgi:pimeloyl-ACP methyl ester carboxylesterase